MSFSATWLGVAEAGRSVFLREACKGDEELRSEVESLLACRAFQLIAEEQQYGPYHILSVLGVGGMGEVYKARDTRLNRSVAIKVLPRHLSERTDLRRRLKREARAIASLDHPHICALYDIGQERGINFLVLQYLEGETLSQRLENRVLPTEHMMRYAIEITDSLNEAHRKGVVHRDLKPSNIMVLPSSIVVRPPEPLPE
jgi:serine/threonine protein kinase